jgi:hypothetical protein
MTRRTAYQTQTTLELQMAMSHAIQRSVDVEWLVSDANYAREIMRVCEANASLGLAKWIAPLKLLVAELERETRARWSGLLDIDLDALASEAGGRPDGQVREVECGE